MDKIEIRKDDFSKIGVSLIDAVIEAGFAKSKSEARRFVEVGSIRIDGKTAVDVQARLCHNPETNEMWLLTAGKE